MTVRSLKQITAALNLLNKNKYDRVSDFGVFLTFLKGTFIYCLVHD